MIACAKRDEFEKQGSWLPGPCMSRNKPSSCDSRGCLVGVDLERILVCQDFVRIRIEDVVGTLRSIEVCVVDKRFPPDRRMKTRILRCDVSHEPRFTNHSA